MHPIARLFVSVVAFPLVVLACSSSADSGQTCTANGGQCVCSESCSRACEGASCEFVCKAGQSCSFACAEGNCRVSCEGSSSCNVDCAKGGCTVSGGTGKTDVKCGNTGTCTVACQGTACTVDGKDATGGVSSSGGIPEFDAGL